MQTNTILQQMEKKKKYTEQLFGKVKGEYCGDWYNRRMED